MPCGKSWQVSTRFYHIHIPIGPNQPTKTRKKSAASSFRAIGSAKNPRGLGFGRLLRPGSQSMSMGRSGRIQSLEGTDRMPLGHSHISKGTKNKTTPSLRCLCPSDPCLCCVHSIDRSGVRNCAPAAGRNDLPIGFHDDLEKVGGDDDDLVRMFESPSPRNSEISLSRGRRWRWRRWRGRGGEDKRRPLPPSLPSNGQIA